MKTLQQSPSRKKQVTADSILNTALTLAEESSWEAVRLQDIADALNITLNDIRHIFREKENLTDAWFDRADSSMLKEASKPKCIKLSPDERVQHLITTWLTTLDSHRRITREIIYGKLEPGHFHVQIPALLRISRTVQWLREAAHREKSFMGRILEESYLTLVFTSTFLCWLYDDSIHHHTTQRYLQYCLKGIT